MNDHPERQLNQDAYRRLKEFIRQSYPQGHFVALSGGAIVADAAAFEELHSRLKALGKDPVKTLIVEAGVDYPEYLVILAAGVCP